MSRPDPARQKCREGLHSDPDSSGMCIYCCIIIDQASGDETPNDYRRSNGWPDVPLWPAAEDATSQYSFSTDVYRQQPPRPAAPDPITQRPWPQKPMA